MLIPPPSWAMRLPGQRNQATCLYALLPAQRKRSMGKANQNIYSMAI
nr:hypothetical protein Q903MT_gene466 [Picea sitchensis]